jgi:hypothetical protein
VIRLRLLASRPVWVTALLLAAHLAFRAWAGWTGAAKLEAAGLRETARPVSVEVVLAITPEPFHMAIFQDAGRLVAVRGQSVFLLDVPPAALRDLASRYWVRGLRPWTGG